MAYSRPFWARTAHSLFPLALFNKSLRRTLGAWLRDSSLWAKCLYFQSFMIIQPPDIFPDGRVSMCDGCPDSMIYDGRLIWKCRVDELQKFGDFIQCAPRR
jgi:hypothetical protein